ncbi:MAG: acetyl-CoA carboxylase biotin carboxyl carrier protein [Pseudomonadota bacterium]
MDLRKIKKLIELAEESGIAELEVTSGEESVRIAMRGARALPMASAPAVPAEVVVPPPAAPAPPAATEASGGTELVAPLAGTFYVAATPGAAPFVQVGDTVDVGQTLCIIESMKMMNAIAAERAGTITAVLGANGEPVAAGQALFLLR